MGAKLYLSELEIKKYVMRKLIVFLLVLTLNFGFCQSQRIYLAIEDYHDLQLDNNNNIGVYTYRLSILNPKTGDTDNYNFIANLDPQKSILDNGTDFEIENKTILTKSDLQKKSPCEVHDLCSNFSVSLIYIDKVTKKAKHWLVMYLGTNRNIVITKHSKL